MATALGLIVPALIVGVALLGVRDPQAARASLLSKLDARLELLAGSVPELLWNLDTVGIETLAGAVARSPDVVHVSVHDLTQGVPLVERAFPERHTGESYRGEREVRRRGQLIGRVTLELDDHLEQEALTRQRGTYLATVGVQLLLSLLLVLLALHARVVNPVRRLGRFARAIARGRFDVEVPRGAGGQEIERLAEDLGHMQVSLRQQFATQAELLARLRGLADTVPGVVFQLEHSADGRWTFHYVSDAARRYLGFTPQALQDDAQCFFSAIDPGDRDAVRDALAQSAAQGLPWQQDFRSAVAPAGGESVAADDADALDDAGTHWLHANALCRREADGTVRWHGFLTDVTRQRRDREELATHRLHLEELVAARTQALTQATREAEAANRAKTAFLANMSHEIRTPLNAITGLTYLMRRQSQDEALSGQLDKVGGAAQHLLAVVNQVLDLSKIEAGKLELEPEVFRLESTLETVQLVIAPRAGDRGLCFETTLDPALAGRAYYGDNQRIIEVLINFAGNAVKFTERGGVSIHARRMSRHGGGVVVRFEVRDTGIGIDAQALPRLFREFEQADTSTTRRYGGTGLGLVISRRLAELMHGSVGVESAPGEGSVFWLELPLQRARDAGQEAATAAAAAASDFQGERVLLAEDNPVNVEIAVAMLESMGLQVDVAADGQEALERADPERHGLILMDVQMPRLDGLQATRELRRRGWTHPILAMTANAFDEERDRCLAAGMDDHVPKPVIVEQLRAALYRWLQPPTSRYGSL